MTTQMNKTAQLYYGDCLDVMSTIPDKSVDMILCDLPYGTTCLKWDNVIDSEKLWAQYERIIKDNGAIVLFSAQPFTSALIMSNIKLYRYSWVWDKCGATGFLNANYAPLKATEDINVFSKGTVGSLSKNPVVYYPQGVVEVNQKKKNNPNSKWRQNKGYGGHNKLNSDTEYVQKYTGYPTNILRFKREAKPVHPTQKPVSLLEFLVKSYTLPGETVLDNCMGSGSTGVACANTGRAFIGIEKEQKYFETAKSRIEEAYKCVFAS